MSTPIFSHRGFMLDVCRHYMPVGDIKRLIDAAAICGMNRMHWHLTDDQGWRIEIKRYPRLTEVGARRGPSYFGDVSETENNCGFYTQEEVRRIVAYAASKGVGVIPEIELPGHACAMLAAYPHLGCRRVIHPAWSPETVENPYPHGVQNAAGIYPDLACAGRDEAIQFLKDVLDEVVALFPFPMVHIGGDEAPKLHWRRCPDCQRRMKEEGIAGEDALQRWLVLKIGEYLAEKGRDTIVWNDVLAGGLLPKHFIVQQWKGNRELTSRFLEAGGRVIVSDTDNYYFDYPYGRIDAHHIWRYPLVPPYAQGRETGVLGVECCLWTERITNLDRAAWMLFPRMTAVGLRLGGAEDATWEDFTARLKAKQAEIDALGLACAPEALWHMPPEAAAADAATGESWRTLPSVLPSMTWEVRMLRQEALERLLEEIGMPREFACVARDWALAELDGYEARVPEDVRGADIMAGQLLRALENREDGPWRDVPESVWIATMKCYTRFVKEHFASFGVYGFDRGFWTTRQVDGLLFRLGEMEYERVDEDGRREIALHIPSDARLEPDALNVSVAKARAFMKERFADWADAPMTCDSWLLSPALKSMLPPTSRILRFQTAFDLMETYDEADDALQWVFGLGESQKSSVDLAALPEDTTLRRGMKAFLRAGGKVGSAKGELKRHF